MKSYNTIVGGMIENDKLSVGGIMYGGAKLKEHYEPVSSFIIAEPTTLATPTPKAKGLEGGAVGMHTTSMGPANNELNASLAVLPAVQAGKKKAAKVEKKMGKLDLAVLAKHAAGEKLSKANIARLKKLGKEVEGGKVNRLKKAKKWTGFVQDDILSKGLDNAKKAVGVYGDYKETQNPINSLVGKGVKKDAKKAVKKILEEEVKPAAKKAAKKEVEKVAKKVKAKVEGGAAKKPSAWIQHVKDYSKKHNVSYKDAMKSAKASYKK
jgi:hypothetical protein